MVFDKRMNTGTLHALQKLSLSVVLITLNEEKNLPRALNSVTWADEVLVVDSGSQDRTVQVALGLGARVLKKDWMGFGPQKNWAVSQAKNSWVLCLDADECLSPELAAEIKERFNRLKPKVGYKIPRMSFHMNRWIRHGGWYPDAQLRLFHRDHSQWNQALIHESVQSPETEYLNSPLWHYVFEDISHQVLTYDRYSGLQAQATFAKGQKFRLYKLILKPWSKFLECYIWKRGFLDGFAGFFIAVSAAYSVFLRFSKLWEIEKKFAQKNRTASAP